MARIKSRHDEVGAFKQSIVTANNRVICTYVHIFLRSPVDREPDTCKNQGRWRGEVRPAFWAARQGTIPTGAISFRFASDYRMSKGDSVISGANSSHTHEGEQLG
jgi:hypothetical protein